MNRLINLLFALACMMQAGVAAAQPENYNKTWVYGGVFTVQAEFTNSGPVTSFWDSIDNTKRLTYGKNSNICNAAGIPILVTNANKLWDNNRNLIDNGDSLMPLYMYVNEYNSGFSQASLILPVGDSIYYVFTCTCTDSYGYYFMNYNISSAGGFDLMQYAKVDMKLNNYAGKVVEKRHTILDTSNAKTVAISQMMAVKHGNGQDWWLVKYGAKHYPDTTEIYTFRVTHDSVVGPFVQKLPIEQIGSHAAGQSVFSQQGDKYACVSSAVAKVFLADFDRCTGQFSNPQLRNMPPVPTGQPFGNNRALNGAAFSPSGSFLYVSRLYSDIYQLEVDNTDSATAWYKVAEKDTNLANFTLYSGLYMGHDQRIYCGYESPSRGMSYIADPDQKGAPCNFCKMCVSFPTKQVGSIIKYSPTTPPNMPNYALGARTPPCQPPLGVVHTARQAGVNVYPNPTDNMVTVAYQLAFPAEEVLIEFRNMTGALVSKVMLPADGHAETVDVSNLSDGIYYYRLVADGRQQAAGKLLIQR